MGPTAAVGVVIIAELQRKGREWAYQLDVLTVDFLCSVNLDKISEEYDSKIRDSGYFMGAYHELYKNRVKRTYLRTLKKVRDSLERKGENRESLLRLLREVKSIRPEKIPKELSHLI